MADQSHKFSIGGVTVEHVEGSVIRVTASGELDAADAFTLAEWLRSRAMIETEVQKHLRYRRERALKQREKEIAALVAHPRRYWFGFTTERYEPRKSYPFEVWTLAEQPVSADGEHFLVTLIESSRPPAEIVGDFWPDARERFSAEKAFGWRPDPERYPPQKTETCP
jgi:hypothetical protein